MHDDLPGELRDTPLPTHLQWLTESSRGAWESKWGMLRIWDVSNLALECIRDERTQGAHHGSSLKSYLIHLRLERHLPNWTDQKFLKRDYLGLTLYRGYTDRRTGSGPIPWESAKTKRQKARCPKINVEAVGYEEYVISYISYVYMIWYMYGKWYMYGIWCMHI